MRRLMLTTFLVLILNGCGLFPDKTKGPVFTTPDVSETAAMCIPPIMKAGGKPIVSFSASTEVIEIRLVAGITRTITPNTIISLHGDEPEADFDNLLWVVNKVPNPNYIWTTDRPTHKIFVIMDSGDKAEGIPCSTLEHDLREEVP